MLPNNKLTNSTCQGPDPNPRPPLQKAPPKACDTHAHIFGPQAKYPYVENRNYSPPDAPVAKYLNMLEALGIERGIIVHASLQGIDNQPSLDALAQLGRNFRGVAVVNADVSRDELRRLNDGGMRGTRMTSFVTGGTGPEHIEELAKRIADFGWLAELHLGNVDELVALAPALNRLPTPYLIDHFGRVRGDKGMNSPGFQALLRLLGEDEKCWVKLSSFYRLSSSGPPQYADMVPLAKALITTCPERIVWGSNWPHAAFGGSMPNDGDLLDQLAIWEPNKAIRNAILSENPTRLFGFD